MKTFADALRFVYADERGCWIWAGCRKAGGYGMIRRSVVRRSPILAHRYFYEQLVGSLSAGHHVHHTCKTPPCVNPRHLVQMGSVEHLKTVRQGSAA